MTAKSLQIPMLNIRAGIMPSTIDEEKMSVEVTWTTGQRGLRSGFWDDYFEELGLEPENVRLDRLIGAVVLDQHRHDSIRNTLGVVEDAYPVKATNGKVKEWRARIRFCDAEVFAKVRDGFIRFVSVGYFVNKYEELEERQDDLPIFRAVDWTPAEISFVTVPFDSKASVRSSELKTDCVLVPFMRSANMQPNESPEPAPAPAPEAPPETRTAPAAPTPSAPATPTAPAPAPDPDEARARAYQDFTAVRQAAEVAGFSQADITRFQGMLSSNVTVDDVRTKIVTEAYARAGRVDSTSTSATVGDNLQLRGLERGIQEVLLARALPKTYRSKLTEAGTPLMRFDVTRLAESLLSAHGVNVSRFANKLELISHACKFRSGEHSTSDFFWLFESAVERVLKDEHNRTLPTYLPLSAQEELPDFRDSHYVTVGDDFNLIERQEGEEITYGTFEVDQRSYALAEYAKGIRWSRKMMINDDLGVLRRLPEMAQRADGRLRSRLVWAMILGNGQNIGTNGVNMGDKKPLFHADHKNLVTTGSKINKDSVAEARMMIRAQRAFGAKDAEDTLELTPEYLVCGPQVEQDARDFIACNYVAINQETAAALNLANSLTLIVENRITDNCWFLVAPPPQIDGIITATLQGQEGLFLDTDEDFETDGFKMKARLDFGVHMARWEGWVKNPGA